jgi:hypothetical protein
LTFSFSSRTSNPLSNLSAGLYVIEDEEEKLIVDVTIPQTILSVPAYAFFKYKELKSVNIHKDVIAIGTEAFIAAQSLENINVSSENLQFIEQQGFLMPITKDTIYGVSKNYVDDIELPNELLAIPAYCFYKRNDLTQINIPETVTSIGEYAFFECTFLTKVNLPEKLTSLGNYAFYKCTNMTELVYNCINLNSMSGKNYCFYQLGYNKTGLTFTIGEKVEKIADYLFQPATDDINVCARITKLNSGKNSICTSIGQYSF